MQILLPPSETKNRGGSGAYEPSELFAQDALAETRSSVRSALAALCTEDPEGAVKALKLGVKNRDEVALNEALTDAPALPAIERYTGVLFDALGAYTLDADARAWVDTRVFIQSALFGRVRAADRIPAYRLSASTRLPLLGETLKRAWGRAHQEVAHEGFVLDLRSKDYAALAPLPEGAGHFLTVANRSDGGEVRALNHFNKAAKGDLVRRLAQSRAEIGSAEELIAWGETEGLEFALHGDDLVLITELGAPARPTVDAL